MASFGDVEGVLEAFLGEDTVKGLSALVEEVGVADADPVEAVAVILEGPQLGADLGGVLRADGERADVVEGRGVELRGRQGVAAAHRQAGDGAGRRLGDDAETLFHEGDDLGDKALDIGIGVSRIAEIDIGSLQAEGLGRLLVGIAVGHHDDHRHGLSLLDKVVEDLGGAAHRGPGLLVAAASVEEIKDGILDLLVLGIVIAVRSIDDHSAVEAELGAVIPQSGEGPAVLGLIVCRRALAGDEHHIEVAGAVALDLEVDGVVDGHSVHDEIVGVDLRLEGGDGDFPDASLAFLHRDGGGALRHPVSRQGNDGGVVSRKAEGD